MVQFKDRDEVFKPSETYVSYSYTSYDQDSTLRSDYDIQYYEDSTVSSGFGQQNKQITNRAVNRTRGGDSSSTSYDYSPSDLGRGTANIPSSSATYSYATEMGHPSSSDLHAAPLGPGHKSIQLPSEIARQGDDIEKENNLLRNQNRELRALCEKFQMEIQSHLSHVNRLETQLRNAKFSRMTDTDASVASNNAPDIFSMGNSELQKELLEINAVNKQLIEERNLLKRDIDLKKKENLELVEKMKYLMADIEYDETHKKNRTNWWGGKKKYKAGEAAKTAAELQSEIEDLDQEMITLDKVKDKEIKKKGALAEAQRLEINGLKKNLDRLQDQLRFSEEERIRLEKEKSKFEGETLILQKERWSDKDRLNKLEAHNELLKNQQRHAATETALTYSKAIKIPLPDKDGNTELDRLRVMVQIQEDALRRVTIQKDQLQDMMDNMERNLPSLTDDIDVTKRAAEIAKLNKTLMSLNAEKTELDTQCKRLKARVTNLENDNEELKKTVQHLSHNLSKVAQRDKAIKAKQAIMIGQALSANEDLASQLAKIKLKNVDDLTTAHGEIKTVFAGRANEPTSEYAMNKKLYPTATAKRYSESSPVIRRGAMMSSVAQTDPMMISIPAATFYKEPEESSESSYAYTYIEEEVMVPVEKPAHRSGVQIFSGGHQGLPTSLRQSGSAPIPGDEYERIANDEKNRLLASQALKSWNDDMQMRQNRAPPLR